MTAELPRRYLLLARGQVAYDQVGMRPPSFWWRRRQYGTMALAKQEDQVKCEDASMTSDLIARAQAGDDEAFAQLIDPFVRELQVHCYRILGSVQDSEDAFQETLLTAWQGFSGFQGLAAFPGTRENGPEIRSRRQARRR